MHIDLQSWIRAAWDANEGANQSAWGVRMAMGGRCRYANMRSHGAQGEDVSLRSLQGFAWPGIQGGRYLPGGLRVSDGQTSVSAIGAGFELSYIGATQTLQTSDNSEARITQKHGDHIPAALLGPYMDRTLQSQHCKRPVGDGWGQGPWCWHLQKKT